MSSFVVSYDVSHDQYATFLIHSKVLEAWAHYGAGMEVITPMRQQCAEANTMHHPFASNIIRFHFGALTPSSLLQENEEGSQPGL